MRETGFFKCEAIFLKVRLLTYKQIIAIKSLDVQLQYEYF